MVRQCAAHTHTHNSIRLSGWKCVTSQMHWYEHTTIEQQIGVAENKIKHLGIKLCDFQSFFTWWPTISRKLSFSNGVGVVETNAMAMTTATHKKPHIRQLTMVISQLKINFSHLNLLIIQCDHVFIILGVHVFLLIRARVREMTISAIWMRWCSRSGTLPANNNSVVFVAYARKSKTGWIDK